MRFRTRKHFALLIFLAVEPRQHHRRDRLADLLWPDAPHAEGRHSLATALSVIRGKLGPRSLETTRETVRLATPDLEVDLERLARGDILGDDLTPPLEVAGFLDEFDIGRAPEYMFWRDLMRARLFPQIRTALALLMDRCRRSGDFTRIEGHADRLLALDELNEDAIRAKMEARAFAGDRLSALRIYQAWRERLARELGASPSSMVDGIALRLRQRGYEAPGTAHIPTVPTDHWRNRPFVGRASQYRVLYERWEETHQGRAQHGLVVGESGIGKTTLVERLVTAAGLEGAVSSRVQCYEVEREFPYAAIGTLMRGLLDRPGAGATQPEWLAELARFVPGVTERYPNLPPPKEGAGESARLRLAEAVHELVSAVADEHPLILVVDDVHLADDVSVAVLHLLMRRVQDQRVMVILTARHSELSQSPHAARLLEQQAALGLALVDLPPLTDDEMNEMITALAQTVDATVPPAVRRALLRASTGVPMLAELLFDDWRIHADACLALAVGAMTVDAGGEVGREVYHRIFERMLDDLSPPARAVLNLAAILGDRLNDLSMYELVDLTLAQTLTGMAELAAHRVLRDGGREMEFRNELLRNYAYFKVPSPLRRALHGLIADRLVAAEARGERVPGLMLAWHCFRAGRGDHAVPHLLRGAREAIEEGAPYDAEFALRTGMPNVGPGARPTAVLIMAESLQEQGRWTDSLKALEQEEMPEGAHRREKVVLTISATTNEVRTGDQASLKLSEVEAQLAAEQDKSLAIRLIRSGEQLAYRLGDREASERLYSTATALGRGQLALSDEIRLTASLGTLAWMSCRRKDLRTILDNIAVLSAKARAIGLLHKGTARMLHVEGCIRAVLGDYTESLRASTEAHALYKRILDEQMEGATASNIAMCHFRLGNYEAQKLWANTSVARYPRYADHFHRRLGVLRIASAHAMQGEYRKAIEMIEREPFVASDQGPSWSGQADGVITADVYLMAGEKRLAYRTAQETLERESATPLTTAFAGTICRWTSLIGCQSGNAAWAIELVDGLIDNLGEQDLVDTTEILVAREHLGRRTGRARAGVVDAAQTALSKLPEVFPTQMRRLGIMP